MNTTIQNNASVNTTTAPATFPTITEDTTLGELLAIIGDAQKAEKIPSCKVLRETAGDPIAACPDPLGCGEGAKVYANGYASYDNGSGRTVMWLPDCIAFMYHFDPMKDSEKGGEIKETVALPEGLLESERWPIAVTLIGEHRIEANMQNRTGGRAGTRDFDADDNGDKDGDTEAAVEESFDKAYTWREGRFGENPEDAFIRKETREEMLAAMADTQREVFILYYKEGYKLQEIADMLGITKQSAHERLHRATRRLKKIF